MKAKLSFRQNQFNYLCFNTCFGGIWWLFACDKQYNTAVNGFRMQCAQMYLWFGFCLEKARCSLFEAGKLQELRYSSHPSEEKLYSLHSPDISQSTANNPKTSIETQRVNLDQARSYRLELRYSVCPPEKKLCSLHCQDRSQSTACILHTGASIQPAFSRPEPMYSLHSPDRNQYTACILQRGTNMQPASSRQVPIYSLHSPDRSQYTSVFSRHEPIYSLFPPDRSQYTACFLQTGANIQPAFSRQEPIYSLHPPDRSQHTACILQTGANIQPAFSRQEPVYDSGTLSGHSS